ncbi:hypothetical protein BJY01DRAFT_167198 [Aspergillus pseudoustus]|uniref:DUF7053 domain-containing protein n=1 Tax=Aspergillus pseudoustus TaxID=1810923 RepID=A0ABR4I8V3_9EURO
MLRKKESYVVTTPIPATVPRTLALDILHSHGEIITLNPLVLTHKAIKAPRNAPADEYYSTWYEITERVQYVPGLGKMGSGKISFKGCFHDEPWGLTTHTYAPMSIDLKNVYSIVGNEPGETPDFETNAPGEGLFLKQDVTIECNMTLMSFVKGQMKASTKVLVDRFLKKAELLDAGVLQGMIEDGKLRTYNPADRTETLQHPPMSPSAATAEFDTSRRSSYQVPKSPMERSQFGSISSQASYPYNPRHSHRQEPEHGRSFVAELPADTYHPYRPPQGSEKIIELPDNSAYGNSFPTELPAAAERPETQSEPRKHTFKHA